MYNNIHMHIPEAPSRLNLPPLEVRLFNTETDDMIETPLDERGLVDLDALVAVVKGTVVPEFNWASNQNTEHHLQWYERLYKEHDNPSLAVSFRGLSNRRAYIPKMFHNWTHRITLPPPVPSEDAMFYSVEAQRVAIFLSRTASDALRLTRSKKFNDRTLQDKLDSAFEQYHIYLDNAREVPREFSLLKIEELEAKSVEEMLSFNRMLGRLAISHVPLRARAIQAVA